MISPKMKAQAAFENPYFVQTHHTPGPLICFHDS